MATGSGDLCSCHMDRRSAMTSLLQQFRHGMRGLGVVATVVGVFVAVLWASAADGQTSSPSAASSQEPCSGLRPLTMIVSSTTLRASGELSKSSTSTDGTCAIEVTLRVAEGAAETASTPAICTVTATPMPAAGGIDVTHALSSDCVDVEVSTAVTPPTTARDVSGPRGQTDTVTGTAYAQFVGRDRLPYLLLFTQRAIVDYQIIAGLFDYARQRYYANPDLSHWSFAELTRSAVGREGDRYRGTYYSTRWSALGTWIYVAAEVRVDTEGRHTCNYNAARFRGSGLRHNLKYKTSCHG